MEGKSHKILVVGDQAANIKITTEMFGQNYDVITADTGLNAVKLAHKYNPDIVLLDVIMHDVSGFEILKELKNSAKTMAIPVILITDLDNNEDEERGLLLGAVDYITKPVSSSIVKARVLTHLKMVEYIHTIEQLTLIDPLTELPNRRGFDRQISAEWGRAARYSYDLSMLMIDVDYFKKFNDSYRHSSGDIALKTVANVISRTIKRSADFAARWGGEEFAVLLPDTSLAGAMELAEMMRQNVESKRISLAGFGETGVTVSIGVCSIVPDRGTTAERFIDEADKALYAAKAAGRNVVRASVVEQESAIS